MNTSNLSNELLQWGLVARAVAGLALLALAIASGLGPAPAMAQAPSSGTTAPATSSTAGAQAWIEYPTAGETLSLEPVRLVVYATDAAGVASVELRMNGALLPAVSAHEVGFDPSRRLVRLEQPWSPDKEGKHILEARGLNSAGGYGEPAFVEFCVGTCQPSVRPTTTPSPAPVTEPVPLSITFTADRTRLLSGQCAMATWNVEGEVAAVQFDGQEVPRFAQTQLCPPRTTTYTLVAIGTDGARTARELTLNVEEADTPTPTPVPAPVLQVTFTANPTNIVQGQCALLQWTVQGNPTLVTIDGQPVNPSGQSQVCPPQTTTYILAATVAGGAPVERTVTITVMGITPPPVLPLPLADIRLWADSDVVAAGSCTMIRWHVSSVKAYWVDGEPGAGDDGSRQVCPCQTETHTLHAVKMDDSQQDFQVTIQVRGVCVTPSPTGSIRIERPFVPVVPFLPVVTPTSTRIIIR